MKLSARNILKGKITEVKKGQTTTHVFIPDFTELDSSCSHAERASMTKSIFGARRYRSLLQTLR